MKRTAIKMAVLSTVLASFASASAAHGAITTFFGEDEQANPVTPVVLTSHPNSSAAQASFLSNLSGVTTQNFESFATNTYAPLTVAFGSDTATISGSDAFVNDTADGLTYGRFATSGTQYLETDTSTTVTFSHPQAAFGFYATDIGDFGGQVTLSLANGGSDTLTVPGDQTTNANGSVLYYGFIVPTGSEFTSVTFGDTAAGTDVFGFDDLTIGESSNVVPPSLPEPASAGLLAVGGAAACIRRRRR